METGLFRKSSLERIATPERLNEYIKITRLSGSSLTALPLCLLVLDLPLLFLLLSSYVASYIF